MSWQYLDPSFHLTLVSQKRRYALLRYVIGARHQKMPIFRCVRGIRNGSLNKTIEDIHLDILN